MKQLPFLLALIMFTTIQLFAQPTDTLWSENWEGDWVENWFVDGGSWQVGTPSYGPDTTQDGANCAGTVLAGEYDDEVDTRLVRFRKFIVPPRDQYPRLRFWHWFSLSDNDYGYVQIKTENGDWQTISPSYYNTSSDAWSYSSVDLSAFADSLVQIAFYFKTRKHLSSPDVSSGWYIDGVQLITGNYLFSSEEDFENGYKDWFAERGAWELGVPGSGPAAANSGDYCLATNLDGNYDDGNRTKFISPPFRVKPASENPSLRFWHWFSFNQNDYAEVYIKTANQDWIILSNRFSTTSSGVWTTFYSDLSDYADSVVQIGFYFHSDPYSSSPETSSGWYIDDIKIDGLPLHDKIVMENDLGVKWLDPMGSPLCGTSKEQPITVQVNNYGRYDISNFELGYSIDNGERFVNETVYETVEAGDSIEYTFRWKADMSEYDHYNCMATVNVVYDVNDTNDVASALVENDRLIWEIETSPTECGKATGQAEITSIEGRPGPYKYNWTSGNTELVGDKLESGVYFITVTDALGCKSIKSFTIHDEGAPEISDASVISDITCYGMSDGSINIVPVGGAEPYNFEWSNGFNSQNISNLRKGQYDVTITDANGCAKNHSFSIDEPAPLRIKFNSTDAVCGDVNGTAELRASGGTEPYTFKWNSNPTAEMVSNLEGGLYTALVTDNHGCVDFTTVSISEIDAPQIIVTSLDPATCNQADGSINISVADETVPYSYSWSDGSESQDISNVPSGEYSVTVYTEDGSCSSSQIIEIPAKETPSGEICMITVDSVSDGNIIVLKDPENPDEIISTNIYMMGKTGDYQYMDSMNPSATNSSTDAATNTETTSYRYRITQVDACGNESEPSTFHETMHVVATPDYSLNRANLFWNAYQGVDYDFFQIFRYSDLGGLEVIDSVPRITNKDFYTFSDLNPPEDDSVYYVIVIEVDDPCNSIKKVGTRNTIRSNKSKKSKSGSSTSIAQLEPSVSLQIYPNPNTGVFNVRMKTGDNQEGSLRVIDAQGRVIRTQQYYDLNGSVEQELKLPGLSPGFYYLQMIFNDAILNRSFVVE